MSTTGTIKCTCNLSGINFVQLDSITSDFTSSISHEQTSPTAATSYEIPIFAENSSANKVKAFAITTDQELDICKLVDASDASQFDIKAALGGGDISAGTYIFPTGSGPFSLDSSETITGSGNDITDLIFSTKTDQSSVNISASILYDK
jgi:hypothetical protein